MRLLFCAGQDTCFTHQRNDGDVAQDWKWVTLRLGCLLHVLVLEKIPFLHVFSVCTRKELEWLQEGLAERSENRKHTWI